MQAQISATGGLGHLGKALQRSTQAERTSITQGSLRGVIQPLHLREPRCSIPYKCANDFSMGLPRLLIASLGGLVAASAPVVRPKKTQ
jgi:hypothetical protein